MTLFKVADGWHKSRKRIRAGLDLEGMAAQGLWVDVGSWVSDEGVDGWVPASIVDCLAPVIGRDLAKRLERAGLWRAEVRDGEDGWHVIDPEVCAVARDPDRPKIPIEIRLTVYARDGHACVDCGTTDDLTLDHIHPYSLGGPDTEANLQTMCRPCNSRKGVRVA